MKKWKIICICLVVSLLASFTFVLLHRPDEETEQVGLRVYDCAPGMDWGEIHRPNS